MPGLWASRDSLSYPPLKNMKKGPSRMRLFAFIVMGLRVLDSPIIDLKCLLLGAKSRWQDSGKFTPLDLRTRFLALSEH